MADSHREMIGKALDLLRDGLRPFVERELEGVYKDGWQEEAARALHRDQEWHPAEGDDRLDIQALLLLITNLWREVFAKTLGHAERNLAFELRTVRNKWAHQEAFSADDTLRSLDSVARLLEAIGERAQPIRTMHRELLRRIYDAEARQVRDRVASEPIKSGVTGLPPWREIIAPHADVAKGSYMNAEFAADLVTVHEGTATDDYQNPAEFFRRTFLTGGLRSLLTSALLRLTGQGGDPVVDLQTNFGGGKTHSLLALYHLFSGADASTLTGVEDLMAEVGVTELPTAHRVVLAGTNLSPSQSREKPDGTVIRTLWGELAWQLGGREGYALVAESDRTGVSPGSAVLRRLFERYSPALILIDEWMRYVAPTYQRQELLIGGSFDDQMGFAQSLTEAATQSPRTLLVAAIPASDIETGGEGGEVAKERLIHIFGRLQSPWRPATSDEGFEIVRRRLFSPLPDAEAYRRRDAVCGAFARHYQANPDHFPREAAQPQYLERLKSAYPIHPELFDRLYGSWSTIDAFQRTRGVLRLMAAVIHTLWEQGDQNPLILPSLVPIADPSVQRELTHYLPDNWAPVIEVDVDGERSVPLALDNSKALGRYSAARRVARTIYLGTAPLTQAANRGIDERAIHLGCVQVGEDAPVFGDALRRLTDQSTYLYTDHGRYWYSTQPSVNRLARDRADQVQDHEVERELQERLQKSRSKGLFGAVHIFPESSDRVADEEDARLVVLGPRSLHSSKDTSSSAIRTARDILEHVGDSPRYRRNQLLFLAADVARWKELESGVRDYLAWRSIVDQEETLNLDPANLRQANEKLKSADQTVDRRIKETFIWLIAPHQPSVSEDIEWQEQRLTGEEEDIVLRASRKAKTFEWLYDRLGGPTLRFVLDQAVWMDRPHVLLKDLARYFTSYLYLPRLQNADVLVGAVRDGLEQAVKEEGFAYAERFDESQKRYIRLRLDRPVNVAITGEAVLVKPDVAYAQIGRDQTTPPGPSDTETSPLLPSGPAGADRTEVPSHPRRPKRFHAVVRLDPLSVYSGIGKVQDEVVQHLTRLVGADVQVTLEIHADVPDGMPEDTVRTVRENCQTLHFQDAAFEEE